MRHWIGKSFISALLWLGLATISHAETKAITLVADPWCPFNCEPGNDRPGYMVEIAQHIFEPLGYTVEYKTVNWSRALAATRNGNYDAVLGATVDEAAGFVLPDQPQGAASDAYFVNSQSDITLDQKSDFEGRTIGLIRDYDYGNLIDQISDIAQLEYVTGDDALMRNIKKLAAKRLDVVVDELNVFRFIAADMGLQGQFRLATTDVADPVFIAFSPAHPRSKDLAAALDVGLTQMRQSGALAGILAKYGLSDWQSADTVTGEGITTAHIHQGF